jgi:hypothetical protein
MLGVNIGNNKNEKTWNLENKFNVFFLIFKFSFKLAIKINFY